MHAVIEQNREAILKLANINGVTNVRVFGSMARGDASDNSDADFLVELSPGKSGLALGGFLAGVSELLHRKVDVVTEKAIHPKITEQALKEAIKL